MKCGEVNNAIRTPRAVAAVEDPDFSRFWAILTKALRSVTAKGLWVNNIAIWSTSSGGDILGFGRMDFMALVGQWLFNGPVTFTSENRMAGPLCSWFRRLLPGMRALSKVNAIWSPALRVRSVVKPSEPCGIGILRIFRKLVG